MIRLEQVSKRYQNGFEALNKVSFSIDEGEMAFITGHSGAGKSTLFKLISKIEAPSAGHVYVHGKNLNRLKDSQLPFCVVKSASYFKTINC